MGCRVPSAVRTHTDWAGRGRVSASGLGCGIQLPCTAQPVSVPLQLALPCKLAHVWPPLCVCASP